MKYYPAFYFRTGNYKIQKGNALITTNPNQRKHNDFYFESDETIDWYHSEEFAQLMLHFSFNNAKNCQNGVNPFSFMPISRQEYQKAINSL